MRALAFVFMWLLLCAVPARAATPDVKGFDHAGHAAALAQRGQQTECVACHPVGKQGALRSTPDRQHRPCADAGCHSPWPLPPSKQEAETYCLVCHRKSDVAKGKTRAFYPPYDVAPEHGVAFPHARHAAAGASLCAACHPGPTGSPPLAVRTDAHRVCASCHERGPLPRLSSCASCHKPIASIARPAKQAWDPYQVTYRFDHVAHARKTGEAGRACATCHDMKATMARPRMETCGTCHDGKKKTPDGRAIFSVTGTLCKACHKLPPGQIAEEAPATERARFSHASHAARGVATDCAGCHRLGREWLPERPIYGQDHAPCNDAGCHRPAFFARPSAFCTTCHRDARPYALVQIASSAPGSEFGRDFSHLAHVRGLGENGGNRFCSSCHQGKFDDSPTTQSHAVCATCHGSEADPRMTACQGCHGLGQPRGAVAARNAAYPWYVRATFQHDTHARDPRSRSGNPTPCLLCHDQVAGAARLADIGRPRMQQCDTCHDGKMAFKTTGFDCFRCHTGAPVRP